MSLWFLNRLFQLSASNFNHSPEPGLLVLGELFKVAQEDLDFIQISSWQKTTSIILASTGCYHAEC